MNGIIGADSAPEQGTPLLSESSVMQEQRGDGVSVERITVLLADGHRIIRKGLRALLEAELDMEVVGEAENGRKAVKLAVALHPDVVVIDIAMPLLNGLEATRQILQAHPASKLLILSAHSDDAYVEEAIVSGVAGYLLIHASSGDLAKAIREIQNGKTFFSPSIAKRLQKQCRSRSLFAKS
jgi:DNA-binding NarL/FixJ family response regulator